MDRTGRDYHGTCDVCQHAGGDVCLIAGLRLVSPIDRPACGSAITSLHRKSDLDRCHRCRPLGTRTSRGSQLVAP